MRLTFSILIAASSVLQASSVFLKEPSRLVQTDACFLKDLFKTPPPPPKGDPEYEIGGIDINLISANKHKSGDCGGGKAQD